MYYYNNELPPQQGWICPKCGRVNAPWLPTCGCVSSQTRATFDTTSLTAKQTEPMTYEDWHGFDEWRDERNEQTEPSYEKCDTCINLGELECGMCTNDSGYKPRTKTEPQTDYKMPYEDCEDCETHLKAQMERRSDEQ